MKWVLLLDIIHGLCGVYDQMYYDIIMHLFKISSLGKIEKLTLLKSDAMVTEGHWMVTEWSLKCTCHSVHWMITGRLLNRAFTFLMNGCISSCDTKGTYHAHTVQFQIIYLKDKYQTNCKVFETISNLSKYILKCSLICLTVRPLWRAHQIYSNLFIWKKGVHHLYLFLYFSRLDR